MTIVSQNEIEKCSEKTKFGMVDAIWVGHIPNHILLEFKRVTLNNVDTEIKENHDKIKTLTENYEALTLRVENLTKNISSKDKEIKELKEENDSLKTLSNFGKISFYKLYL